jgi:hypothetical protein
VARAADITPTPYSGTASEYIVRLTGTSRCTGTIYGKNKVVTAAHCIKDFKQVGKVRAGIVVEYKGLKFTPRFAIWNPNQSLTGANPATDAAILVFDQAFPGPSATIGSRLPASGGVTAVGFQSTWPDGRLVRPLSYNDKSHLQPGVNVFGWTLTSCPMQVSGFTVSTASVGGQCGMIPGGSGGPLLVISAGGVQIVGVLSTVNDSLTWNTWASANTIKGVVNRASGIVVTNLGGPLVGGAPFRS